MHPYYPLLAAGRQDFQDAYQKLDSTKYATTIVTLESTELRFRSELRMVCTIKTSNLSLKGIVSLYRSSESNYCKDNLRLF